jgi:serine/threonine protein kinase
MGVVYKAQDTKLKRTVALKFLPPELTRDEDAKTRFIHEAQAASALQHNNICTIHEIDETGDGRMFISMDCYEGETLKKKIARGPLAVDEAIMKRRCCTALRTAIRNQYPQPEKTSPPVWTMSSPRRWQRSRIAGIPQRPICERT